MSKLYDVGILIFAVFLGACLFTYIASIIVDGYDDDNEFEETLENVVEEKSGLKIDLSPKSRDPDDGLASTKAEFFGRMLDY